MKNKGHDILIVASKKDVALNLLDLYKLDYINIGSYGKSLMQKIFNLLLLDIKMFFIVLRFKPDLIMGIATIRGSHAGWFLGKKVYVFTDTEHAKEQIALFKPFATKIFTPTCFLVNLGPKQVRYNGYHELAYLHPKYFTPNTETIIEMGIKPNEKYFVVRFVSWEATHDIGQKGLSYAGKKKLIKILDGYGKIIITSEAKLPEEFRKYQIKVPPTKIFDLLYFSSLYIGEGATIASEAAILGIPSIYISTLKLGYLKEQEEVYGVQNNFTDEDKVFSKVEEILNTPNFKTIYKEHSKKMTSSKIDVTSWIIDLVTAAYE
jgi:hypothetical protein